jgi:DNA-binding NarL/FixJ family response regulator
VSSAVLIDDSVDMRTVLRVALARCGVEVVGEAADATDGIRAVRETAPDLVVVEIRTPGADGPIMLPSIRELVPHARIVVLTSRATIAGAALARAEGADHYLVKGTSLRHVMTVLRRAPVTRAGPRSTGASSAPSS